MINETIINQTINNFSEVRTLMINNNTIYIPPHQDIVLQVQDIINKYCQNFDMKLKILAITVGILYLAHNGLKIYGLIKRKKDPNWVKPIWMEKTQFHIADYSRFMGFMIAYFILISWLL